MHHNDDDVNMMLFGDYYHGDIPLSPDDCPRGDFPDIYARDYGDSGIHHNENSLDAGRVTPPLFEGLDLNPANFLQFDDCTQSALSPVATLSPERPSKRPLSESDALLSTDEDSSKRVRFALPATSPEDVERSVLGTPNSHEDEVGEFDAEDAEDAEEEDAEEEEEDAEEEHAFAQEVADAFEEMSFDFDNDGGALFNFDAPSVDPTKFVATFDQKTAVFEGVKARTVKRVSALMVNHGVERDVAEDVATAAFTNLWVGAKFRVYAGRTPELAGILRESKHLVCNKTFVYRAEHRGHIASVMIELPSKVNTQFTRALVLPLDEAVGLFLDALADARVREGAERGGPMVCSFYTIFARHMADMGIDREVIHAMLGVGADHWCYHPAYPAFSMFTVGEFFHLFFTRDCGAPALVNWRDEVPEDAEVEPLHMIKGDKTSVKGLALALYMTARIDLLGNMVAEATSACMFPQPDEEEGMDGMTAPVAAIAHLVDSELYDADPRDPLARLCDFASRVTAYTKMIVYKKQEDKLGCAAVEHAIGDDVGVFFDDNHKSSISIVSYGNTVEGASIEEVLRFFGTHSIGTERQRRLFESGYASMDANRYKGEGSNMRVFVFTELEPVSFSEAIHNAAQMLGMPPSDAATKCLRIFDMGPWYVVVCAGEDGDVLLRYVLLDGMRVMVTKFGKDSLMLKANEMLFATLSAVKTAQEMTKCSGDNEVLAGRRHFLSNAFGAAMSLVVFSLGYGIGSPLGITAPQWGDLATYLDAAAEMLPYVLLKDTEGFCNLDPSVARLAAAQHMNTCTRTVIHREKNADKIAAVKQPFIAASVWLMSIAEFFRAQYNQRKILPVCMGVDAWRAFCQELRRIGAPNFWRGEAQEIMDGTMVKILVKNGAEGEHNRLLYHLLHPDSAFSREVRIRVATAIVPVAKSKIASFLVKSSGGHVGADAHMASTFPSVFSLDSKNYDEGPLHELIKKDSISHEEFFFSFVFCIDRMLCGNCCKNGCTRCDGNKLAFLGFGEDEPVPDPLLLPMVNAIGDRANIENKPMAGIANTPLIRVAAKPMSLRAGRSHACSQVFKILREKKLFHGGN